MTAEEWREIPGWPGYMASSEGRIRSHVIDPAGRLMSVTINPQNRYPYVGPSRNGRQQCRPIHVLVALAFHGPRPEGMEVRHLDGVRTNAAAANLAWGTHTENMADAVRHGTAARKAWAAERGHCLHGHPYNNKNTRWEGPSPVCRVCDREQVAVRRARKRLAIAAPSAARTEGVAA